MTQARTVAGSAVDAGAGEFIVDATQLPTDITWDDTPSAINRMLNVDDWEVPGFTTSASGEIGTFVPKSNGRVLGCTVYSRTVATDGTNGWRVSVRNEDQSDQDMADFGFGTGSNAAAADDNEAQGNGSVMYLPNSLVATSAFFNRGDILTFDIIGEDGTAGDMDVIVHLSYESQGHV